MTHFPFRVQVVPTPELQLTFSLTVTPVGFLTPLLVLPFKLFTVAKLTEYITRKLPNYKRQYLLSQGIANRMINAAIYQKFFQQYGTTIKSLVKVLNGVFYQYLLTELKYLEPVLKIRSSAAYKKGPFVERYRVDKLYRLKKTDASYLLNLYNTNSPLYKKAAELYYCGIFKSNIFFDTYLTLNKITHYFTIVKLSRPYAEYFPPSKFILLSNCYTLKSFELIFHSFNRYITHWHLDLLGASSVSYYKAFNYNYARQTLFLRWFFKQPLGQDFEYYLTMFNFLYVDLTVPSSRYKCSFR